MGEGSRSGGLGVWGTSNSVPDEVRSQLTPKARTGIAPARGREESVPGGRREPGGATGPGTDGKRDLGSLQEDTGWQIDGDQGFHPLRLSEVKANRAECRKHFNRCRIFETFPALFSLLLSRYFFFFFLSLATTIKPKPGGFCPPKGQWITSV